MYTYRPLRSEDYSTVCAFPQTEEELFFVAPTAAYPLTPHQFASIIQRRVKPTVVTDETRQAVAFADIYNITDTEDGKVCWLGNVIAAPAHRGKGAGPYLVQTMCHIAREQLGITKMRLVSHNTNVIGLVFYKKMGFKPYDLTVAQNKQGQSIIRIHMEKALG